MFDSVGWHIFNDLEYNHASTVNPQAFARLVAVVFCPARSPAPVLRWIFSCNLDPTAACRWNMTSQHLENGQQMMLNYIPLWKLTHTVPWTLAAGSDETSSQHGPFSGDMLIFGGGWVPNPNEHGQNTTLLLTKSWRKLRCWMLKIIWRSYQVIFLDFEFVADRILSSDFVLCANCPSKLVIKLRCWTTRSETTGHSLLIHNYNTCLGIQITSHDTWKSHDFMDETDETRVLTKKTRLHGVF